jgi:hypothetical protein
MFKSPRNIAVISVFLFILGFWLACWKWTSPVPAVAPLTAVALASGAIPPPKLVEIKEAAVIPERADEETARAPNESIISMASLGILPVAALPLMPQLVAKWTEVSRNVMAAPGRTWDESLEQFRQENSREIAAVESASGQRLALRRPGQPGYPATLVAKDSAEPPLPRRTTDFHKDRAALLDEARKVSEAAATGRISSEVALKQWEDANSARFLEHRRKAVELHEFPWDHAATRQREESARR